MTLWSYSLYRQSEGGLTPGVRVASVLSLLGFEFDGLMMDRVPCAQLDGAAAASLFRKPGFVSCIEPPRLNWVL